MKAPLALGLISLMFVACGSRETYLPDGGRARQVCQNNPSNIAVTVQNLSGEAISGAEITARNTTTGVVQTATTGGNGTAAGINDGLGTGQIEFTAVFGTLRSQKPFFVELTCGECDCIAIPGTARLTVQ